jgi:hypothetical protein
MPLLTRCRLFNTRLTPEEVFNKVPGVDLKVPWEKSCII